MGERPSSPRRKECPLVSLAGVLSSIREIPIRERYCIRGGGKGEGHREGGILEGECWKGGGVGRNCEVKTSLRERGSLEEGEGEIR